MKKLTVLALMMLMMLLISCAAAQEVGDVLYASDFSAGTDGWYPRSTGAAKLAVTNEGLLITGRSDSWHSPGRDFPLIPGNTYRVSVKVKQDTMDAAQCILSVAYSTGWAESYGNIAQATVRKGQWTELTGSYTPGEYERFVLYVETSGAQELDFTISDFQVEVTKVGEGKTNYAQELPSLRELYAPKFDFGCAVNITQALDERRMAFYAQQFSIMTHENELKPDSVLDLNASRRLAKSDETAVAVRFDAAKPLLDFCWNNGIKVHGHVLVWHSQTPDAFFREGYRPDGEYVTREVMLARMDNYIREVLTWMEENYPGLVVSWDVVNEAVDDNTGALRESNWTKVVGDDFVLRAFESARRHAPGHVKLFYNDYNTAVLIKQAGILRLLDELIADGNIDGYGFQMHHDIKFPSILQIMDSVTKVAGKGLLLRVSELDVTIPDNSGENLEKQAKMYAQIMKILEPYADRLLAVQVWGVADNLSWRASQYPLLFDAQLNPKPAFWSVVEAADAGSGQ